MALSISSSAPLLAVTALKARAAGPQRRAEAPTAAVAAVKLFPRAARARVAAVTQHSTAAAAAVVVARVVAPVAVGQQQPEVAALQTPPCPAYSSSWENPLARCCAAARLSPDSSRPSWRSDPASRGWSAVPTARSDRLR